jgi:hypothetical protein
MKKYMENEEQCPFLCSLRPSADKNAGFPGIKMEKLEFIGQMLTNFVIPSEVEGSTYFS